MSLGPVVRLSAVRVVISAIAPSRPTLRLASTHLCSDPGHAEPLLLPRLFHHRRHGLPAAPPAMLFNTGEAVAQWCRIRVRPSGLAHCRYRVPAICLARRSWLARGGRSTRTRGRKRVGVPERNCARLMSATLTICETADLWASVPQDGEADVDKQVRAAARDGIHPKRRDYQHG